MIIKQFFNTPSNKMNSSSQLEYDDSDNINYFEYFEKVYSSSLLQCYEFPSQVSNLSNNDLESTNVESNVELIEAMAEDDPKTIDVPDSVDSLKHFCKSLSVQYNCLKISFDPVWNSCCKVRIYPAQAANFAGAAGADIVLISAPAHAKKVKTC